MQKVNKNADKKDPNFLSKHGLFEEFGIFIDY